MCVCSWKAIRTLARSIFGKTVVGSWDSLRRAIEEKQVMRAVETVAVALVVAGLMALSAGAAVAQESPRSAVVKAEKAGPTKPPKVVSKSHQPVGTPHKVSSYAPRPTNKRVYGDPIQAPIVHSAGGTPQ